MKRIIERHLDVILNLLQGERQELHFENLDVDLNEEAIQEIEGLRYYYSCGTDDAGKFNVGTERGIAFVARAPTIEEANLSGTSL